MTVKWLRKSPPRHEGFLTTTAIGLAVVNPSLLRTAMIKIWPGMAWRLPNVEVPDDWPDEEYLAAIPIPEGGDAWQMRQPMKMKWMPKRVYKCPDGYDGGSLEHPRSLSLCWQQRLFQL